MHLREQSFRRITMAKPPWMDLALAVIHGKLLALIYTKREDDVRVISFRPASREERKQFEEVAK
jgi:uncharacterized DUF497 family protein